MKPEPEPVEDTDLIADELRREDERQRTAWRRHLNCVGDNLCAECAGDTNVRVSDGANPQGSQQRMVSLAARWREDAARHRVSCRLHEGYGDRGRADRHYQRSLDLDACAAALETELRAGSEANS